MDPGVVACIESKEAYRDCNEIQPLQINQYRATHCESSILDPYGGHGAQMLLVHAAAAANITLPAFLPGEGGEGMHANVSLYPHHTERLQ